MIRRLDVREWVRIALGGLCLATLFALAAPLGWPFELFSHFRPQYAAAALILALLLVLLRRPWPAVLAGLLAVFHALPAMQRTVADEPVAACSGPEFTVITANLQFSNHDTRPFLAWLAAHPADLVVVQEVTTAWAGELSRVATYPHQELLVREDPYGIGVLSRWPLEAIEPEDFAGDGLPSLSGRVAIGGAPLRFLALHTHWPIVPSLARARDESLGAAAELLRSGQGPAVALGDLNLTVYSPEFARLLTASGLRDSMHGAWWRPTWMAGFWPLALRIDHVLVSPAVCVESTEVGPSIGSDHRPVIARLRLAAPVTS
ncbi:MAG: endonuclease/exonuclease/phosphatase family protein [Gammaproteobacteria bacterium]|nr:endonuclease/exonuclease/phosphatase family protein [Gammaproteobacteria bacterium]